MRSGKTILSFLLLLLLSNFSNLLHPRLVLPAPLVHQTYERRGVQKFVAIKATVNKYSSFNYKNKIRYRGGESPDFATNVPLIGITVIEVPDLIKISSYHSTVAARPCFDFQLRGPPAIIS